MQTVASRLPHDDLVAELKALNARFIHNYVTNDVDSHDAMMHPDFICIGPKGTRQNRTDYLKQWATQFDPEVVVYWDVRDEVITIIDNVALVRPTRIPTCSRRANGSASRRRSRHCRPRATRETTRSSASTSRESASRKAPCGLCWI